MIYKKCNNRQLFWINSYFMSMGTLVNMFCIIANLPLGIFLPVIQCSLTPTCFTTACLRLTCRSCCAAWWSLSAAGLRTWYTPEMMDISLLIIIAQMLAMCTNGPCRHRPRKRSLSHIVKRHFGLNNSCIPSCRCSRSWSYNEVWCPGSVCTARLNWHRVGR